MVILYMVMKFYRIIGHFLTSQEHSEHRSKIQLLVFVGMLLSTQGCLVLSKTRCKGDCGSRKFCQRGVQL